MVELFRLIVTALQSISGLTVIETSLASVQGVYSLPAAVIDFEPTQFTPLLEDSSMLAMTPAYTIVLHVQENPADRSAERTAILNLYEEAAKKIAAFHYSFMIRDVIIDYVPFGSGRALGCGFLVRFNDIQYNLS